MSDTELCVHHEGRDWYPFQVFYSDADGRQFSFNIYAISREHAACVVDDIRNTASLGNQVVKIIE